MVGRVWECQSLEDISLHAQEARIYILGRNRMSRSRPRVLRIVLLLDLLVGLYGGKMVMAPMSIRTGPASNEYMYMLLQISLCYLEDLRSNAFRIYMTEFHALDAEG